MWSTGPNASDISWWFIQDVQKRKVLHYGYVLRTMVACFPALKSITGVSDQQKWSRHDMESFLQ